MPVHEDIKLYNLDEEINLLEKANKRIIAIVPTLVNVNLGVVQRYAIIFKDKE